MAEAKGGGTWRILVEEGKTKKPTQSGVVGGGRGRSGVKQKIYSPMEDGEVARKTISSIQKGLLFSAGISRLAFNQYFSITGQNARRNAFNTTITYGAAIATVGLQLAKGNIAGAAAAAVGTAVMYGNQVVNFQRNITEQNASAEYLRQLSNTSVSANRGDLYSFSLF